MTQPIPPDDYVPPPIDLEPKYVVFQASVPGRLLCMPERAGMASARATYFVSLLDWSCTGEVNGLVLADPEWWEEHCAEVGQQVKAKLKDLVT